MDPKNNAEHHDIMSVFQLGDHGHDLLAGSCQGNEFYVPEEQKTLGTCNKRKGRPKGLKTIKNKPQDSQQKNTNKKSGHWAHEQKKKYHWFLEIHSKHFITKQLRRMDKIFKIMSDFIGTREAEQCRSHHQKMQKKFKSFYKILKNLRNQFYTSASHENVKEDLEGHEIFGYDPLITQQVLNSQNPVQIQENQQKEYSPELELEVEKNNHPNGFFFCDNYQKHFGDI